MLYGHGGKEHASRTHDMLVNRKQRAQVTAEVGVPSDPPLHLSLCSLHRTVTLWIQLHLVLSLANNPTPAKEKNKASSLPLHSLKKSLATSLQRT